MIQKISIFALLALSAHCQQLPDNPKPVDKPFAILAGFDLAATGLDAYTTHRFVGQVNCPTEGWNPWLYGQRAQRAPLFMAAEAVAVTAASYWLKKHHSTLWRVPFLAAGSVHTWAAVTNFRACL